MKALIEEIRKKGIAEMEEGPLMKRLTSLRIGGPAPLLIRPHSEEGLWEVLGFRRRGYKGECRSLGL
jgi:UDP-N-acetylenolpyruvoylglucosamine reductase